MLRTAISALLVGLIALVGGASSVAWVLASGYKLGAVRVGPWTSFPDAGTRDADPYARAEVAIDGILSLGRAEGVGFSADRDSDRQPLEADCSYVVSGHMPPGRFWTLRSEPLNQRTTFGRQPALHSRGVLRSPDDAVAISVGRRPKPGNWLQAVGEGRMRLVLTVYDSSATAGPASGDLAMPSIKKAACDG